MPNLRAALHHTLAKAASIILLITPAFAYATDNPPAPAPAAVLTAEVVATRDPLERAEDKAVNRARGAALADGITTHLALTSGAMEMNPLVPTSPLGLVALTAAKIGLVKFAETLPEHDKRLVLKTSAAIWGGAAVNNFMVLLAAPTPLAVVAGVVVGVLSWRHTSKQFREADRELAAAGPVAPEPAALVKEERVEVAFVPHTPADAR